MSRSYTEPVSEEKPKKKAKKSGKVKKDAGAKKGN